MIKKLPLRSLFGVFLFVIFAFYFQGHQKVVTSVQPNSWTEEQSADCGVVLTGGPGRTQEGLSLLQNRMIRKLIISGVNPNSSLDLIFPQKNFYTQIETDDVILERRSGTTFGNAQQTLPIVEALNCRDLLVITSRLHMARAKETFIKVFPSKIQLKYRATPAPHLGPIDVVSETFKSIFYHFWLL